MKILLACVSVILNLVNQTTYVTIRIKGQELLRALGHVKKQNTVYCDVIYARLQINYMHKLYKIMQPILSLRKEQKTRDTREIRAFTLF